MSILVLADLHEGQLAGATAYVIAAAQQIGGDIDVLVAGEGVQAAAEAAAKLDGVSKVRVADNVVYAHQLAEPMGALLVELADGYTHVLASASTTGKNVLPRLAALKDVSQLSDVLAVDSADTFKRPIYAGNAIITVKTDTPQIVATVRTASFSADKSTDGSATVTESTLATAAAHTAFVELSTGDSDRPDLQTASKVISGGRGVGSAENFEIVFDLADKIGAATGASRAAVDAGYVPNDMQVGQTGKIIAPDLYMCFGISGAIQHLTGIKDAGTIVAINKDGEAPIFEVADVGLVGDLFKIIPEMMEKL